MDFRQFLAPAGLELVLPYFGGTRVDAPDRRFRVARSGEGELAPGWWRFKIDRRSAVAVEPAAMPSLAALPAVRGHWAAGWIVTSGRDAQRVALPPDDEPPPLARVVGRQWCSGDVVLDGLEFEDDAELAARDALEHRRPLAGVAGVVPSLRAAFGYVLGLGVAHELSIAVSLRELTPHVVAIADGGRDVVAAMFAELIEQRRREAELARQRAEDAAAQIRLAHAAGTARVLRRHPDPRHRADDALEAAGARMLSVQQVCRGEMIDVTYEVDGVRIMSLVDPVTLQVIDPGLCLAGAHRVLTLDAMPSVVREAIEEGHLNITRRR
ncbi:MAG TPA: hypothetical protein VLX92_21085 [Kofleriaceae bacterium]|nr:hypothetical protein [Kofleriaceae bacterium]